MRTHQCNLTRLKAIAATVYIIEPITVLHIQLRQPDASRSRPERTITVAITMPHHETLMHIKVTGEIGLDPGEG